MAPYCNGACRQGLRAIHLALDGKSFSFILSVRKTVALIALAEQAYRFGADFPHEAPLVPTLEVVGKKQFPVLLSYRANHVFFHNVGDEIGGQSTGINEPFSALADVLHKVCHRAPDVPFGVNRRKVVSSEFVVKICVLNYNLPFVRI